MHLDSALPGTAETVRQRLVRDHHAIHALLDIPEHTDDLVLETLPSGECAWLRPERRYVKPSRPVLTDQGRRALAMEACFGPWPTVARLYDQFRATYGRGVEPTTGA